MSKRKHSDLEALELANPSGTSSTKRQRKNLVAALDDGKKKLFRALKFARGFERQKLGRRQKSNKTKKGGQDIERLEAEVAALKSLDLTATAETYLCRTLIKTKAIAEHAALPEDVRSKAMKATPKGQAYSNVTARMYKSNPVTEAMDHILSTVRRTLGLREDDVKPKKRMRKADYEAVAAATTQKEQRNLKATSPTEVGEGAASKHTVSTAQLDDDDDSAGSFGGFSEDDLQHGGAQVLDSEVGDNLDLAQFDARLASSSDEEDDEIEDDNAAKLYSRRDQLENMSPAGSASPISRSVSVSLSPSPEPQSRRAKIAAKATKSAFLPALATGYISGSDSEASDVSEIVAPKKNRMGQRARQAKWEQKFGKDAKHLKNGKPSQNRDSGWDARRGATDGHRGKHWEHQRSGPSYDRSGQRRSERTQKVPQSVPEKIPTYGSAHPSWLAKQAAKEKASAAAKPAGKKITFD